jgi:hypothetical protein
VSANPFGDETPAASFRDLWRRKADRLRRERGRGESRPDRGDGRFR